MASRKSASRSTSAQPPAAEREDDHARMKVDADKATEAADMLMAAFVWSGAREGGTYWFDIYRRLNALADAAKATAKVERRADNRRQNKET